MVRGDELGSVLGGCSGGLNTGCGLVIASLLFHRAFYEPNRYAILISGWSPGFQRKVNNSSQASSIINLESLFTSLYSQVV